MYNKWLTRFSKFKSVKACVYNIRAYGGGPCAPNPSPEAANNGSVAFKTHSKFRMATQLQR